ncbi:MAG: YifB family Mg chelatase-like AAA ATPase [Dehalococcoidia bacterium]|nr:YifB family Mg chelatase-like AAA ATPase [Dehalococcoidia bacterium]
MSLAKVRSVALKGIEGIPVDVEVDIGSGLPAFNILGLPDAAVQEARERVRAAIKNAGFEFPLRRITVNLAPADVGKEGPIYDLPIAVAVLVASGQIIDQFQDAALVGELSLDGRLRHVAGVLPVVAMCRQEGIASVVVPQEDTAEAGLVGGVQVRGVETLTQLKQPPADWPQPLPPVEGEATAFGHDLSMVQGQEHVKRALDVAAAGGHNILMQGPPGAGKTLLARSLPGLLAPLTPTEAIEVSKVHSVAGMLSREHPMLRERPFRSPHHTISHAGLVGGGSQIRPGEVSLAHRGVLFLDEFPEFSTNALESMREPLESGAVTISRARVTEARERPAARLAGTPYVTNSEMGPLEVRKFCQEALVPAAEPLLAGAMQQLGLSARAFHRVLKVARTVADLGGSDRIETVHLAEAIQYRRRGAD